MACDGLFFAVDVLDYPGKGVATFRGGDSHEVLEAIDIQQVEPEGLPIHLDRGFRKVGASGTPAKQPLVERVREALWAASGIADRH